MIKWMTASFAAFLLPISSVFAAPLSMKCVPTEEATKRGLPVIYLLVDEKNSEVVVLKHPHPYPAKFSAEYIEWTGAGLVLRLRRSNGELTGADKKESHVAWRCAGETA